MFIAMSNVIQCLMIDRLHIIGDIFDTLARFVMEVYENSSCKPYQQSDAELGVTERDVLLMAQMHKAISVIQFKIEGQMIKRIRIQDGGAGFVGENRLREGNHRDRRQGLS